MREDPKEKDPQYKAIFDDVEATLSRMFAKEIADPECGFCHVYWEEKKRLLWENHSVRWESPADLDPETMFD